MKKLIVICILSITSFVCHGNVQLEKLTFDKLYDHQTTLEVGLSYPLIGVAVPNSATDTMGFYINEHGLLTSVQMWEPPFLIVSAKEEPRIDFSELVQNVYQLAQYEESTLSVPLDFQLHYYHVNQDDKILRLFGLSDSFQTNMYVIHGSNPDTQLVVKVIYEADTFRQAIELSPQY